MYIKHFKKYLINQTAKYFFIACLTLFLINYIAITNIFILHMFNIRALK